MNVGKMLFAQVMEFGPWKTFGRINEPHRGGSGVRTLGSADLFRIIAFAQLTWRKTLPDIEMCLTVCPVFANYDGHFPVVKQQDVGAF